MNMRITAILSLVLFLSVCYGQEEIEFRTDGIVLPRTLARSVVSPIKGMLIYDTEVVVVKYYDGRQWISLGATTSLSWNSITGKPSGFADNIDNTAWSVEPSNQFLNYSLANVGIDRAAPQAILDINGAIKLSTNTNTQTEGMIRYNSSTKDFEGFNGVNWLSLTGLPSQTSYEVGDYAEGGVVFWVSPDGLNVKVISTEEIPISVWSNVNNASGAISNSNGLQNSLDIVDQMGHTNSAAKKCLDIVNNGHKDWYLPAFNELTELLNNHILINSTIVANLGDRIEAGGFWTSTETSTDMAIVMILDINGNMISSREIFKANPEKSRAIRSFTVSQ